jgi:N-acetylglutamate synthase-like GNAT family acetyltransferase
MKITLGSADERDIPKITALADDVMSRYEDFHAIDKEKALGWTHLTISKNIHNYVTVYADGIKCGYYLLTKNKEHYEIFHLFVFPRWQGRGIGTALVNHILQETNGNLEVFVFTGDISTYTMFENMGFIIAEIYHRTRYRMVYHPKEMEEYTGSAESLLDDTEGI